MEGTPTAPILDRQSTKGNRERERMPSSIRTGSLTKHFSAVASRYNQLRTTDSEPIDLVARYLPDRGLVIAADVGCGTGRYTIELGRRLGKRLFAYFLDTCEGMLECLRLDPGLSRIRGFDLLRAQAEEMPLPDASLDCVLTFNAVHHFKVAQFLREVGRVLRSAGLLFIYTRLRDQNERSIWGQCFPGFTHKETRLFDEEQLTQILDDQPELAVRELIRFGFQRTATRDCLKERIRSRHYSTFCFYGPDELEAATREFEIALTKRFGTSEVIRWRDEYAMAIAERTSLRLDSIA